MKLHEVLHIQYPFIQGGMAHIATGPLASAVSQAGGLGIIGTGGMRPEALQEAIRYVKAHTDKPFGVNLLMLHREIDTLVEIVCAEKVPVVTTGAGNPGKYMDAFRAAGIKVFPVVPSAALAIRMERLGASGIIAEGSESGGHIGEISTMVLVHQVAQAVNIPVIAAGGIASGRQILAAEALGADGVQMGTVFLATDECPVHDHYKQAICQAKTTQTTVIGRVRGLPTRVLKNTMTKKYLQREKEGASLEELELLTLRSLGNAVRSGDVVEGSVMCGQVVGDIHTCVPVKVLMEELYQSYLEEKEKLCATYL